MCDYEGPLLREVVIEVWDDLNGNIRLSSTWWSYNLEKQNGWKGRGGEEKHNQKLGYAAKALPPCRQSSGCDSSAMGMSEQARVVPHR